MSRSYSPICLIAGNIRTLPSWTQSWGFLSGNSDVALLPGQREELGVARFIPMFQVSSQRVREGPATSTTAFPTSPHSSLPSHT